eukprot:scaffold4284_cov113-Isochrysis_galbana.AAC.2
MPLSQSLHACLQAPPLTTAPPPLPVSTCFVPLSLSSRWSINSIRNSAASFCCRAEKVIGSASHADTRDVCGRGEMNGRIAKVGCAQRVEDGCAGESECIRLAPSDEHAHVKKYRGRRREPAGLGWRAAHRIVAGREPVPEVRERDLHLVEDGRPLRWGGGDESVPEGGNHG